MFFFSVWSGALNKTNIELVNKGWFSAHSDSYKILQTKIINLLDKKPTIPCSRTLFTSVAGVVSMYSKLFFAFPP